jgi:hypothetical protein
VGKVVIMMDRDAAGRMVGETGGRMMQAALSGEKLCLVEASCKAHWHGSSALSLKVVDKSKKNDNVQSLERSNIKKSWRPQKGPAATHQSEAAILAHPLQCVVCVTPLALVRTELGLNNKVTKVGGTSRNQTPYILSSLSHTPTLPPSTLTSVKQPSTILSSINPP